MTESGEIVDDGPEPQPQADGVFVVIERSESGTIQTGIAPQGDVRPTEIETILRIALKRWSDELVS